MHAVCTRILSLACHSLLQVMSIGCTTRYTIYTVDYHGHYTSASVLLQYRIKLHRIREAAGHSKLGEMAQ